MTSLGLSAMRWPQPAPSTFYPPSKFRTTRRGLSPQIATCRLTKRRNRVRPKLLKSLPKPLQPIPILVPQQNPSESLQPHQEQFHDPDPNACKSTNLVFEDETTEALVQINETMDLSVHSSAPEMVSDAFSPRSVLQFAMYFVGLFIFQTFCAIWILGSLDFDDKSENHEKKSDGSCSSLRNLGLGMEKGSKSDDFLLNKYGNVSGSKLGLVPKPDENEFEEKIVKIRNMARMVRSSETKKLGDRKSDSSETVIGEDIEVVGIDFPSKPDSSVSRIKTHIQKEVESNLNNYQIKKLPQSSVDDYFARYMKSSNKFVHKKDSINQADKEKVQKSASRKTKIRSSSPKSRSSSRGFQGSSSNGKLGEISNRNFGDNAGNNLVTNMEENHGSLRSEKNVRAIDDLDQMVVNSHESISLAMEEDESYCLRDEIFKQVAVKVLANERAGREPFSGVRSKDEIKFFRALERKFEREGESAKRWMEMRVKNIVIDHSDTKLTDQVSSMEQPTEPYKTSDSNACRNNPDGAIDEKDQNVLPSEESLEIKIPLSSATLTSLASTQGKTDRSESGRGTVISGAASFSFQDEKELWWQNLPYVLVILLSRRSDSKYEKGFYSLKLQHPDGKASSSRAIAFEDRCDATNFCHLLETFFEDLGDFSADVVPLSIKELKKTLKLDVEKITVVRKGRLQLYAGKPLEEVEMDLRSI